MVSIALAICWIGIQNSLRRCKELIMIFLCNLIILLNDTLAYVFDANPSQVGFAVVRVSNFLVFFTIPILIIAVINYLIAGVVEKGMDHKNSSFSWLIRKSVRVIIIMYAVLLIANLFTGIIYSFDENNAYIRGPWYELSIIYMLFFWGFLFAVLIFFRKSFSQYEIISTSAYITLPVLGISIQYFNYGINLLSMMITLATILLGLTHYITCMHQISDQKCEVANQRALIAEQKNQIAVSQIQPHFIFNVLGSIEQLCRVNPKAAEKATHTFSIFLRSSLNSMSAAPLVDSIEERNLIVNYIELEKMRFGDDIQFDLNIEAGPFKLPLMSIQPLVENAIKHGMKEDEPLTITLRSSENSTDYIIQVMDDGVGFDVENMMKNDHTHIGLRNVSERVRMLCKGRVEIESCIGKGTKITVFIPKKIESK